MVTRSSVSDFLARSGGTEDIELQAENREQSGQCRNEARHPERVEQQRIQHPRQRRCPRQQPATTGQPRLTQSMPTRAEAKPLIDET